MIVGDGDFRYELAEGWEQIPSGWSHGDVGGIATDSEDRVYVFNRGEHPLIVYDRQGKFLGSWGEGQFSRPHGITITPDDVIWLATDTDQTVCKYTLDGKLLQTLGTRGQPSDTGYSGGDLQSITHGGGPFNRPTRLARSTSGELYVSDGYGNARVHRFTGEGEYLQSFGEPGTGPGQFNLPHSVWVHTDGRVFVCDRENDRIQIFSPSGEPLDAWTNVTRPGDLFIDKNNTVYIGEMSWECDVASLTGRIWPETRSAAMTVRDLEGNVLARWGGDEPCTPGNFASPHGLWVDSHGDIYVGEVTQTALSRYGRYHAGCHSLQKFVRI